MPRTESIYSETKTLFRTLHYFRSVIHQSERQTADGRRSRRRGTEYERERKGEPPVSQTFKQTLHLLSLDTLSSCKSLSSFLNLRVVHHAVLVSQTLLDCCQIHGGLNSRASDDDVGERVKSKTKLILRLN